MNILLKIFFGWGTSRIPGIDTDLCSAPRRPSAGLSSASLKLSFEPLCVTESPAPAAGRGGLRGVFVHGDPGLGLTAAPPLPSLLGSRIPGTVTWLGSAAAGGVSTTRARLGLVTLTLSKL